MFRYITIITSFYEYTFSNIVLKTRLLVKQFRAGIYFVPTLRIIFLIPKFPRSIKDLFVKRLAGTYTVCQMGRRLIIKLPFVVYRIRDSTMGIIRLLFVEDEPDIRSVVEIAMQLDKDIRYTSFDNGRSALASLSASQQHFDMALLNFRLPFMTGVELHHQLRLIPSLSNISTALITAHILEDDISMYKSSGIKGYISKPFDPVSLAKKIRMIYEGEYSQTAVI